MIPGVVLVDGCTEHKMSIWKEMAFEILEYIAFGMIGWLKGYIMHSHMISNSVLAVVYPESLQYYIRFRIRLIQNVRNHLDITIWFCMASRMDSEYNHVLKFSFSL